MDIDNVFHSSLDPVDPEDGDDRSGRSSLSSDSSASASQPKKVSAGFSNHNAFFYLARAFINGNLIEMSMHS